MSLISYDKFLLYGMSLVSFSFGTVVPIKTKNYVFWKYDKQSEIKFN